jgi:hypothetical protein
MMFSAPSGGGRLADIDAHAAGEEVVHEAAFLLMELA